MKIIVLTKKQKMVWNPKKFIKNMFCLASVSLLTSLLLQMIYTYLFTFNY